MLAAPSRSDIREPKKPDGDRQAGLDGPDSDKSAKGALFGVILGVFIWAGIIAVFLL